MFSTLCSHMQLLLRHPVMLCDCHVVFFRVWFGFASSVFIFNPAIHIDFLLVFLLLLVTLSSFCLIIASERPLSVIDFIICSLFTVWLMNAPCSFAFLDSFVGTASVKLSSLPNYTLYKLRPRSDRRFVPGPLPLSYPSLRLFTFSPMPPLPDHPPLHRPLIASLIYSPLLLWEAQSHEVRP